MNRKMKLFFWMMALAPLTGVVAQNSKATNKNSAQSSKTKNSSTKKRTYISGEAPSEVAGKGGADSTEGWIIKRTKDGKIIKIPRKQTFKFGGSDVSGEASRPNETLLGNRLTPRDTTLIPERRTYRSEILESVGYTERNRK